MSTQSNPSTSSFHFSPSAGSPLHSPVSPVDSHPPSPLIKAVDANAPSASSQEQLETSSSPSHQGKDEPTPLFDPKAGDPLLLGAGSASSAGSGSGGARPPPPARGHSFNPHSDPFGDRQRRVSYPVQSTTTASLGNGSTTSDLLGNSSSDDIWGPNRTARAASDGLVLSNGVTQSQSSSSNRSNSDVVISPPAPPKRGSDASAGDANEQQERAALFREHERRSLESSAQARLGTSARDFASPPLSLPPPSASNGFGGPTSFFQPQGSSSSSNLPLLSPTSQSPPQPAAPSTASATGAATSSENEDTRTNASLHLGDLDAWMMDEAYIRECCARMAWDSVQHIKLIRGSSPTSGYCFLTFPSAAHAAQVLARFNASPPVLMPRSGRTFKLNWGTGLPGLQPRWTGEYSVFVGDLGRDVGEADLVNLFTPIFPSTKSAKVMCDPSTGLSRGYGFVRFAEESDMQRALLIGQNAGSGLSLHGRTLRISEASGPGQDGRNGSTLGGGLDRIRTRSRSGDGNGLPSLSVQTGYGSSGYGGGASDIVSPTATSSAYPDFLSPTLPGAFSPNGPISPGTSSYGGSSKPLSPSLGGLNGGDSQRRGPLGPGGFGAQNVGGPALPGSQATDPNNTTVFVGGLPACISEETLKSFFHHFGEITYCKIPAGKGCGFVQFVRRQDAELAIAKMNDFPIHGKSRIRLSWGRSQGDKQVEHVRKLASALGVPFEAVWRMVQGQDNTTIKQIATAVGGGNGHNGPSGGSHHMSRPGPSMGPHSHQQSGRSGGPGAGGLDVGAVASVASAAGLTEAEVIDLMGGRNQIGAGGAGGAAGPPLSGPRSDYGGDAFSRSSGLMSPPGSGFGPPSSGQGFGASPYNSIRPDSYLVHSPSSPYANVDFSDGGVSSAGMRPQDRFNSFGRYGEPSMAQVYAPHLGGGGGGGYPSHGGYDYQERAHTTMPPPSSSSGLEDSFANLGFSSASASLPPRSLAAVAAQHGTPSFYPSASSSAPDTPRSMNGPSQSYDEASANGGGAQWGSGWNGVQT